MHACTSSPQCPRRLQTSSPGASRQLHSGGITYGGIADCNLAILTVTLIEKSGVGELTGLGNPMGDFLKMKLEL